MRRRFLGLLARGLVALHPPPVRRRFGDEIRRDYRRLVREEGSTWAGSGRLLRRMGRDARGLPALWRRAWRNGGQTDEEGWGMGQGAKGSGSREATLRGIGQDVSFAARGLLRDRAFSGMVVVVLAVGMALTASVWAVTEAYLLRGFPFPAAERLVSVQPVAPVAWSDPEIDGIFDPPVSWDLDAFTLLDGDRPRLVRGQWVSPGFLEAFGVEPVLGRGFGREEAEDGSGSSLLLSHRLWQERYGGDPGVLGRSVRAYSSDRPGDAELFTVVGVLPPDFWFFNEYTEVLAPLRTDNPLYMGRLAPGVTTERAADVLTRLERARREGAGPDYRVEVKPHQERYVERIRPTLAVLGSGAILVLLIACGNVAMLLLVRTGGRRKELGVRQALGAPSGRIVRQLLGEGLLLAGAAAVLGVLLAAALLDGVGPAVEARLGVAVPGGAAALGIGLRGVGVAAVAALAIGVVFGLTPLVGGLPGVSGGLARTGGRSTGGRQRKTLRNVVVGLELALSLSLLIAAGLTVRSALHLSRVDLGFEPENVTGAQLNLRLRSYPEPADRLAFWEQLLSEVEEIPGVEAAGITIRAPFLWRTGTTPMESEDAAGTPPDRLPEAVGQVASPGYLDAMSIPVLSGRGFGPSDAPGTEPVALVSESLADALWPGESPLGRRFREASDPGFPDEGAPWLRVVGVVPDVWNSVELGAAPDYYVPMAQLPTTSTTLMIRRRPGTGSPVPAVEGVLDRLDPDVPLSGATPMMEATADALSPSRFLAGVLALFSAFAVLLAVLGLYGVVSYAAAQRNRDVAIRMALGADQGRVVRLFVVEAALVVLSGVVVGVAGGLALGRILAGQLRGVAPDDPATIVLLSLLMGAAAMLASWLPARRASRADPSAVMRTE